MTNVTTSSSSLPVSHQVGIWLLSLAFVVGVPGNLFVVWTIVFRVARRSLTCLLVLNLAVADALVLLSAPFFLHFLAAGRGWLFGGGLCKTVHYLCCVNMYASIYLICLMSLDRWLAVMRPFLSQRLRTKRTLWAVLLGLWTLAFLFALPMPFYRSNLQPFMKKNISMYICMPYHWGSVNHEVFQYLWETLLGFLLPFCLIVGCYASIIYRLRSAMFQRKGRGSRLILIIISAFALFWAPYHLVNILQVAGKLQNLSSIKSFAAAARPNVTAFAFLSSSVNPILYVFAGSSYIRNAGLGFMAKLFEGTNSEGSGSFSRSTRSSRSGSSAEITALRKLSLRFGFKTGRDEWAEPGVRTDPRLKAETDEKVGLKTMTTMDQI
ncbi:leukotriene B4 receptor 1-like [Paramormyrops kingsleyae]|uniref:Leukotriene B4 receptor n=1 Tax=Paramormyrops kingsleyae TaxID=1676925 RepID=A0A3B3QJE4_9TELE|nr:leukotriene B4 receptor 1-like [Paramormyrops kingsleyae]XP_023695299.1 leukotriene B4 receptor 1-like [Paramormyrops kingsleyae]